ARELLILDFLEQVKILFGAWNRKNRDRSSFLAKKTLGGRFQQILQLNEAKSSRMMDSEEALHNTDEDLCKAINFYLRSSLASYPTRITDIAAVVIDTCDRQGNSDSQCYISDNAIAAISQVPVCKTNLIYIRKKPFKRNKQPSKLYQSPFISVGLYSTKTSRKGKDEYYTAKYTDLKPKLDFVVAHPVKKSWFYYMAQSSNCWNDERTDWSLLEAYKGKTDQDAFDVQFVVGIVQQLSAYAEYLSDRHQISSSNFDPEKHRTRYASLLWDYGVNKACNGYFSDNQDPPRPKRIFILSEDTKMIDVEP
ncbi:hypothetical protein T459_17027, partial [Capsicum annuum]